MNSNELGRRIKEARLAKKLTQAEVVGDFITRNMLSQIESGAALPSVKTLQYLSRVLEVPMSQLMPEEEASPEGDGSTDYLELRAQYLKGAYSRVTQAPDIPGYADEQNALRERSYLALASAADSSDIAALQQAAEYAKKAAQLSEGGIFANSSVRSEAMLLLNRLAGQLSDYYKSMIDSELSGASIGGR